MRDLTTRPDSPAGTPPRLLRRIVRFQVLVVLSAAISLGAVATIAAPPIFRDHVDRAMGPVTPAIASHLDEAMRETILIVLALGIGIAVLLASVIGRWLATRLTRPVEHLSATAKRLAGGELDARAESTTVSIELDELTAALNTMAETIETTERTRRDLLSDLAHELRTPIATIEGYHSGLRDGVLPADPATLDVLAQATGRLRRLIDDVSLVSRAEEVALDFRPAPIDLCSVATSVVGASRPAATSAGVTLSLITQDGPVIIDGDADRLAQAIVNLVANAIAHTPADGRVEVRCSAHAGVAELIVHDTGCGIEAHDLPNLFQRFYRADRSRNRPGGTGLGLTICRAIIARHHGTIVATSPGPGEGATFTVRLPLGLRGTAEI